MFVWLLHITQICYKNWITRRFHLFIKPLQTSGCLLNDECMLGCFGHVVQGRSLVYRLLNPLCTRSLSENKHRTLSKEALTDTLSHSMDCGSTPRTAPLFITQENHSSLCWLLIVKCGLVPLCWDGVTWPTPGHHPLVPCNEVRQ